MNLFNLKIFKDSIYFKVIFLVWTLIYTLTKGQHIAGYFSLPLIAWGGILVLRNIFSKKNNMNKVTIVSIYLFLIAYVVTIIVNIENNFVGNTKTLIWQAIMMFVLFMSESWKSKEELIEDIITICKTIIVISFIFSLISIALFLLNIQYQSERIDGRMIYQGYFQARLWGIYVDPNQASALAQVSIMASAIILLLKNGKFKKLAISNIIIQYIFMILAASRGGEIAFTLGCLVMIYLLFEYILRKKLTNRAISIILSSILSVVVTVGIIYSAAPTRSILVNIPNFAGGVRNEINKNTDLNIGSVTEDVVVERDDLESTNGRDILWKDGFRLIKYSPILGFGDRNISLKAAEFTPGSSLEKKTVHNGFIEMVLSGGIVALLIMLVLILATMIAAIRVLFSKRRYNKDFYLINMISVIVGIVLCTSIFLTEIFYKNSFAATVFWIFMGYSICLSNIYLKEGK